jgi:Inositol hexakisphosphate
VVEQIERTLKEDVLREVRSKNGKLLLHDELETESGTFEIVPQWEQVTEEDILTTKEVFELIAKEGFKVRELAQDGGTEDKMTSPHTGGLRQGPDRVYQP